MPTVPTIEPVEVRAGDTVKFKVSWSDYPADDGWSVSYVLHSNSTDTSTATATVEADGSAFLVTFSSTQTAALTAGNYTLHGRATKSGESYTVYNAPLVVLADIAAASAGTDLRTWAAKALAAIETALSTNLSADFVTFSVDGQNFTRMARLEAMDVRDRLKSEVHREEQARKIRQGLSTSRNLYVRFQ